MPEYRPPPDLSVADGSRRPGYLVGVAGDRRHLATESGGCYVRPSPTVKPSPIVGGSLCCDGIVPHHQHGQ
ncbi:hypothetical protein BBK36DRAFT_1160092 [Trichoderma citrinoviride]|uniref:Uncharacterized protein n=1 Tax=Trichoderma citrinoviride TaxID=58853 RepID=A0A2T4B9G8_9HYPO|nr:hypothetical protein BBK36DRAFT_1160092 [Trichoderma citrinoviride]PTB65977.1 hypothetical protein BBK36DRAFT_1160092 [Trichoderma citrinoviride]